MGKPSINCKGLYIPQTLFFLTYHICVSWWHHMLSYTEVNVQAFATLLLPLHLG